MSRADYEHWNEEADLVWWQDEGCHVAEYNPEPDDEPGYTAEDAYSEELGEMEDDDGLTWMVTDLDLTIEQAETELPSLEEALRTLAEFGSEHREDDEYGEVARAAIVVLDEVSSLTSRVSVCENQLSELRTLVAELQAKGEQQTEEVTHNPFA